jgi:hypothetical protein
LAQALRSCSWDFASCKAELRAPAERVIEDPTGYALLDLAERTGADFAAPATAPFRTEGGIDVKVTPVEKIPLQYRERRADPFH